jgi:peptidoglycan hydrolase-like protein with peptidoglycan-binding domain
MPYANPLKRLKITSGYRTWRRPTHSAVDYEATVGTPLYAIIDGTVKRGTGHTRAGSWIEIHGDGEMAGSSHLSAFSVSAGAKVRAGDRIGSTGNTGNTTGPHLHQYVKVFGKYVNPHTWLKRKIEAQRVVARQKKQSPGVKTTSDWLTRAQIRKVQAGLRRVFPAYRWKVKVRRGRLIERDGLDGPQTQAWVGVFQKATGLEHDKVVGPNTIRELAKYGIHV